MTSKPWDARLAAALVAPLVTSSVLPNHLTTLRLTVGLAGVAAFATGDSPNLAACLIVGSNFLDHTDGELARMSGKTSQFGHQYDLASDAVITIGMFVGIGWGLNSSGLLESMALTMGIIAGTAVAGIFHLRNLLESAQGKSATQQAQFAGFEAEDILYLMPLVTLLGGLDWFLIAAAIGAPIGWVIVGLDFKRSMP